MRNLLSAANRRQRQMIAALIRTVFAQPDADSARTKRRAVVDHLSPYAPNVAGRLQAMEADVLAYTAFPAAHWTKLRSTNSLERHHVEVRRRTRVIRIFPHEASLLRLLTALAIEQNDAWRTVRFLVRPTFHTTPVQVQRIA